MKNNFMKSLMLHIRYPWTAGVILILWIGLAVSCSFIDLSITELMLLCGASGATTLIIAWIGFSK